MTKQSISFCICLRLLRFARNDGKKKGGGEAREKAVVYDAAKNGSGLNQSRSFYEHVEKRDAPQ